MEPAFSIERAYIGVALAWCLAQFIKIVRNTIRRKRFRFRWMIDTGGMPSSHSAGTAAVATVVGLHSGFDSIIFLLALIFTLVTMFDAAIVRRSVGRQAIILNKMVDEIYAQGKFSDQRIREFLGHTPVQVLAGGCLGIAVSYLVCTW